MESYSQTLSSIWKTTSNDFVEARRWSFCVIRRRRSWASSRSLGGSKEYAVSVNSFRLGQPGPRRAFSNSFHSSAAQKELKGKLRWITIEIWRDSKWLLTANTCIGLLMPDRGSGSFGKTSMWSVKFFKVAGQGTIAVSAIPASLLLTVEDHWASSITNE